MLLVVDLVPSLKYYFQLVNWHFLFVYFSHTDSNEDERNAFNNNRRSNPSLNNFNNNNNNGNERLSGVATDKDGLVIPRKPANPCLESMEHREIHRELKFHLKT